MKNRNRVAKLPRIRLISAAVASCFASHLAFANPTGPIVVNGQVTFHQQGNLLQVTNSPGSIINWQNFSIGANELTRFLQQSPSSAVLNRVVTQNPSAILGALQSNGRVFLINPNGILFGAGAQIDVAGLVASTLKLSDADFLAGRMRFTEVAGAGSVINQGAINTAQGGQVYLVGPAVTNQGIITSPKGEVILAAGNRVELVDPGTPNLRVEITAPDNQAVNLGTIVADAGRVGIHAGLINHSGTIRADSAVVTEDGRIVLRATKSVALESGSVTQASGARGGEISVLAGDSVQVAGRLDASAPNGGDGGFIETSAAKVSIDPAAVITTHAPFGKTGTWLIDPPDFTIASAGGDITGALLATKLGLNNVVISSNDGAVDGNGDIFVNDTVSWSSANSLTLTALRDVNVNRSITNTGSGAIALNAVGDVNVGSVAATVPTAVSTGGVMTVTAGDSLTVQGGSASGAFARLASGGGQSINAENITVIGGTGAVDSFAEIRQQGAAGSQTIDASGISVMGGASGIGNFARIRNDGVGAQTIHVAGPLSLTGGTGGAGAGLSAQVTSSGGQNITAAGVVLTGGNVGADSFADIRQTGFGANQSITVTGGGTLSMQGGLSGSDNFARIRNDGTHQQINFPAGGAIVITGGNGPNLSPDPQDSANNFARIENRSLSGMQTINTGTITLTSGLTGADNFAGIQAAHQSITTSDDVTLVTRAGGGTRIGAVGATSPTDVVLNVGGKLTLIGSSETDASIGANQQGGFTTAIAVTAAGDITLNPGDIPGAEVRIGSPELAVAGGNISLTSTGGNILLNDGTSIRTLGDVTMNAPAPGKGITEGSDSVIQANQLTTLSAAGANLGGANQLARFSATNTTSGPVTLSNASSLLTVNGVSQVQFGALTINQAGDLTFTGTNTSGPQSITATGDVSVIPSSPTVVNAIGSQSITAGGGLVVRSSAAGSVQLSATGGQTINASYVEVTAQDAGVSVSNFGSGDQIITTSGMNAAGEGLALRNLGGAGAFATISQSVQGGTQVISVNNADRAVVDGIGGNALISDFFSGTQTVSVTGATSANALALGSPGSLGASQIGGGGIQTVSAGLPGESGSISIHGKAQGGGGNSIIVSSPVPGGTQTISTSGTLTVSGGNSPAGTQGAGIFANGINGQQRVNAGGIALQGGAFGDGNNAAIGANNGTQEINAGAGGLAMVGGGIGATNSSAVITGATQIITSGGDVILLGGSNSGNSIRIGGRGGATPSPTDLALHAAGGVVLTSGSASGTAAVIGNSNVAAAQPSDISINAGGSVILNASSQSGSRIGQSEDVPGAGGDISITAGGNIHLNGTAQAARIRTEGNVDLQANQPGGMISSSGNAFVRANQLTTTSRAGTGLAGPNQVAAFNAVNTASGELALTNTSPLLTVTGVSQVPSGSFTLNQAGDLAITGNVFSGPLSISATGDMVVGANGNPVILYAAGPQGVTSSGAHASWPLLGVGLLDRLAGHGPIDISARSLSVRGGNTLGSFTAITGGPISITTTGNLATGNLSVAGGSGLGSFAWVLSSQDIDLTVGGNLTLSTGTGLLSFARMQTVRPTSLINVHFPNLSEGGYFVNGIEGAYRNGLTGFFAGPTAAKPGLRLITTYGE